MISAAFNYEPHYCEVLSSRMHYLNEGRGDPIVHLYGNPIWSYLWRNIIPYLRDKGRVIAPDLIGMGRSDKPNIEYRLVDHALYLEALIAALNMSFESMFVNFEYAK